MDRCEFCEALQSEKRIIKLCGGMPVCDYCIHVRENHKCRICGKDIYWHDEKKGTLIINL